MIIPVLHRIIVKPDLIENKDPHFAAAKRMGLEVVKAEKNREQAAVDTGVVVSVGPTAFQDFIKEKNVEIPVKVGDSVVYAKYSGKTVEDPEDGIEYVAVNDEDIVAVVTKNKGA